MVARLASCHAHGWSLRLPCRAFTIDLDLPDYVYGILVRETGRDGTQTAVADWAGIRFMVDTVAPAPVADLAAS